METSSDPTAAPARSPTTAATPIITAAPPAAGGDAAGRRRQSPPARPRRRALVGLGAVAAVTGAVLAAALTTWGPSPADPPRGLTVAEFERLAAVRVTNYRDGRARLRARIGSGGSRVDLMGWVDWTRPLTYLDVGGPGAGPARGLVQAVPRLVVARPDPTAILTPAAPPLAPPADGWRVRDLPDQPPLDVFLDVLFGLAADRPDRAATLRAAGARWIARETVGAIPVDVIQLPVGPSTGSRAPASATPAGPGGGTRYWVDRDARLHRLDTRLPGGPPLRLDLDRSHRPPLRAVDALGGNPGLPRDLTWAESRRLARMPARHRALRGVAVTLSVPVGTTANLRGGGWIDWAGQVAYLSTVDLDTPGRRELARYDRTGVARLELPAGDLSPTARPPLPPPDDPPWRRGRSGSGELDVLVGAALRAGRHPGETGRATWLRRDSTGNRPVDVVEFTTSRNTFRYWLDRSGVLRRLELRTGTGAWAQLDLTQAPVPRLPAVPTARPAR